MGQPIGLSNQRGVDLCPAPGVMHLAMIGIGSVIGATGRRTSQAVIVTTRQIHGPALQDCFHRENALDREDVESLDELLVEGVVAGHPARDDLDEIIPIAADAIEIGHLTQALHMFAEGDRLRQYQ